MPACESILLQKTRIERLLPTNFVNADREDFAGQESYETFTPVLRSLKNARVSGDSVIFRRGAVDEKSLYTPKLRTYFQTRYLAKKLLRARKYTLDNDASYLLATDQESIGHFHWLTEVLTRLWLVRERAAEFTLLLPDKPYVRTIGAESLKLLGLDFNNIVWIGDDDFVKVPNLYHITRISRTGQFHDEIVKELRRAFIGEATGGGSRMLYISRAGADRRKILNEEELIGELERNGFDIFTGEKMDLKEQVKIFSECRTIVGIHGAGLTNCLFMPPGIVVELRKKEPNYGYWHLAGSLGHKYYYYNGTPDSEMSLIGSGCNLTINVRDFANRILGSI